MTWWRSLFSRRKTKPSPSPGCVPALLVAPPIRCSTCGAQWGTIALTERRRFAIHNRFEVCQCFGCSAVRMTMHGLWGPAPMEPNQWVRLTPRKSFRCNRCGANWGWLHPATALEVEIRAIKKRAV